ncbi:hypothetical protein [Paenibacillus koleovorans]|nr:hypothetical protein [Paenibacillus koleovorans]
MCWLWSPDGKRLLLTGMRAAELDNRQTVPGPVGNDRLIVEFNN